jgi:hypothetical protein
MIHSKESKIKMEVSIRNMWIGIYPETWDKTKDGWKDGDEWRRDIWIALIPFVVIHITQTEK